jgi:hypothetical protein
LLVGEGVFTETFKLSVTDPVAARDEIVRYVRLLELQVDQLAERHGRLGKLLIVSVTGTHDQLEAFRDQFARGSSGWASGGTGGDLVLGLVLEGAGEVFGRWRRKRRRERSAREQEQSS